MPDDVQDQGSQIDGNPPEPSQNLEGNNPDPSQENTDQLTDQQVQDMLPDQDDRGVSAENVLGEMRRKMDKLMDEISTLKLTQNQPQQFQQPYQQPGYQQQIPQRQEQIIPRDAREIAEVVRRESQEKFGANLENAANYYDVREFENRRFAELNELMINKRFESLQAGNVLRAERDRSFNRVVNLYPELNNIQSHLTQAVFNEVNRRANLQRVSPQAYLERDPYAIESIAPMVASQLGISAKSQNAPKIVQRPPGMPPSNFPGKQTQVKNEAKPTQADIDFSKRFGIKPESLARARNMSKNIDPNDTSFVDNSGKLYS